MPDGVLNVVHGGEEAVEALSTTRLTRAVSFVGSAPVARAGLRALGPRGKRVQALAGAKNHLVVMPDADLDLAVPAVFASAFSTPASAAWRARWRSGWAGSATSWSRASRAMAREARVAPGPGLDADSTITPVTTAQALERIARLHRAGRAGGRPLLVDGRPQDDDGFFLGPTVFDGVLPR